VSNEALLQVGDPTSKTKYTINGTPCYWVPPLKPLGTEIIADGTISCLHDQRSFVVMRQDVEMVTSPWPGFQNDLVTVRVIMRFGFAWPYEKAVVMVTGTLPTIPGS
jgi:HK97 family phage major capsid protein